MKKIFVMIFLLAVILTLTACKETQYTEEEKAELEQNGWDKIYEVLPEGCEVLSLSAYIDIYPSGPQYLTSYVKGEYKDKEDYYSYFFNVYSEEMYSSKYYNEVSPILKEYILENLNLKEADISSTDLEYGLIIENNSKGSDYFEMNVLPIEVTDVKEYVRNIESENRKRFRIRGEINFNNGCDLSVLNRAALNSLEDECRLSVSKIYFYEENQKLDWEHYSDAIVEYTRWNTENFDDYQIYGVECAYIEKSKISKEKKYNLKEDYKLIKENDNYIIKFNDMDAEDEYELRPRFYLYANDDSKIASANYKIKNSFYGSNDSREFIKLNWVKQDDELWELCNYDYGSYEFDKNGMELIYDGIRE